MATLNIRNIDDDAVARLKTAAAARGLTVPQYVALLVDLHETTRAQADAGDDALQAELAALGLDTVRR